MFRLKCLVLVGLVFVVLVSPVYGVSNDEVNAGIQFNFSTPGARSLAFGGAFIGLADDATAAFTNPAGLTQLSKPEVSFEFREWTFTSDFTQGGVSLGLSEEPLLLRGQSHSRTSGLSYFSFVYPKERWVLAFYRHEVARFEESYGTDLTILLGLDQNGVSFAVRPIDVEIDLDIVNFGFSAALELSEKVSLGIGVSNYFFAVDSSTERFGVDKFEGPVNGQSQSGSDEKIAYNLGLLWQVHRKLSLGAVYRQGPEFSMRVQSGGILGEDEELLVEADQVATFRVPEVYGVGLSWKPVNGLTINFDYDRVHYSDLTSTTIDAFFEPDDQFVLALEGRESVARLEADDADEFHLGFEYVFSNLKYPLALRVGGWTDPDHKIHFEGVPVNNQSQRSDSARFRPGEDVVHVSIGLGVIFGEKLQIDAAADFSDLVDTVSISGVIRF